MNEVPKVNTSWLDDRETGDAVKMVAAKLGRQSVYTDSEGYECEILGAAPDRLDRFAYVESRSKDIGYNQYGANQREIDVTIKTHYSNGNEHFSADIESYNPFFGCGVRYFDWFGQSAILIYEEKHSTYVCRLCDTWPPAFIKIEYRWRITDNILSYIGYKQDVVQRLELPNLTKLEMLQIANAQELSQLPPEYDAG